MERYLVVTLQTRKDEDDFSFKLEQEDYPDTDSNSFEQWMIDNNISPTNVNVINYYDQYASQCNDDGVLTTFLRVYLSDINIPYTLNLSYGELQPGQLVTDNSKNHSLEFNLDTESSIDYGTITKADWEGSVFNVDGIQITPPAITIDGGTITVPEKVVGTVKVISTVQYHRHEVLIAPRELSEGEEESLDFSVEDYYGSTATLFVKEEVEKHKLNMPSSVNTCNGPYNIRGEFEEDPDEPAEDLVLVNFTAFDYCSGEDIEDFTVKVDGKEINLEEGVYLEKGEHSIQVTSSGYLNSDEDDLSENDTFTL